MLDPMVAISTGFVYGLVIYWLIKRMTDRGKRRTSYDLIKGKNGKNRMTLHELVKKIGEKSGAVELPPPIEEELKRRRKNAK